MICKGGCREARKEMVTATDALLQKISECVSIWNVS